MTGQASFDFLAWLANNVPLIVGVVGFVGGVVALIVVKPPTYKEVADEARNLRGDLEKADAKAEAAAAANRTLRDDFEAYKTERRIATEEHDRQRQADRRRIGILVDGITAMWSYTMVLTEALVKSGQPVPQPSDLTRDIMQTAREAAEGA